MGRIRLRLMLRLIRHLLLRYRLRSAAGSKHPTLITSVGSRVKREDKIVRCVLAERRPPDRALQLGTTDHGQRTSPASVAKCHTFSTFRNPHTLLATQVTENKVEKKVSHLSHLSPLSHFRVVSLVH